MMQWEKDYWVGVLVGGISATIGIFIFALCVNKPTALDVYRGKTTLEITYRDSVAVDSVVVYKMLDYGN